MAFPCTTIPATDHERQFRPIPGAPHIGNQKIFVIGVGRGSVSTTTKAGHSTIERRLPGTTSGPRGRRGRAAPAPYRGDAPSSDASAAPAAGLLQRAPRGARAAANGGLPSSGCRCPVTHRRCPSTCGGALTTPVSGFPVGGLPVTPLTCSNEARRCAAQGAPWTENLAEARRVAPSGGIRSEHGDPPSRWSEPDSGKYSIQLDIGRGRTSPRPRPAVTSRVRGW